VKKKKRGTRKKLLIEKDDIHYIRLNYLNKYEVTEIKDTSLVAITINLILS